MASRFLSKVTAAVQPYVPGEQPRDRQYIKLNTNECPYPPSPQVAQALSRANVADLRLYPDPNATEFTEALARYHQLNPNQVLACGGSDEVLAYAFMAFFDRGDSVYYPDITYGFYQVYADLFGLQSVHIPLREDFTMDIRDYFSLDGNVFLANPNAPTGIALTPGEIEQILQNNPDRLVVVDEAYADFAPGMSCMSLIDRYDNLLVVTTFSKSRALAGMRLGAGYGHEDLIDGLNRIKFSFNPYNLDRVSLAVGIVAIQDQAYLDEVVAKTIATRQRVSDRLIQLGFEVIPSDANFLFIRHPKITGQEQYERLRKSGILVRYFNQLRVSDYVRVTVGTDDEMDQFLQKVGEWG